jgi:hypothetical protein
VRKGRLQQELKAREIIDVTRIRTNPLQFRKNTGRHRKRHSQTMTQPASRGKVGRRERQTSKSHLPCGKIAASILNMTISPSSTQRAGSTARSGSNNSGK